MVKNVGKLKGKIVENGFNNTTIAAAMGLSVNGFGNKLKGKREFTVDESSKLSNLLNLSYDEFIEIFYGNELEFKTTN